MKYLVMECHPGYAIVLDNDGRFIKAANMNYEVGQTVYNIIEYIESIPKEDINNNTKKTKILSLRHHKGLYNLIASAACICFIALNAWYFVFMTYATVEVKINPDVLIYANSLNYVKNIRPLNEDGASILEDYDYKGKKLNDVSLELTKVAKEKGYLENNNDINIIVRSRHNKWAEKAESLITGDMNTYLNDINREDIALSFTYLDTDELEDVYIVEESISELPDASDEDSFEESTEESFEEFIEESIEESVEEVIESTTKEPTYESTSAITVKPETKEPATTMVPVVTVEPTTSSSHLEIPDHTYDDDDDDRDDHFDDEFDDDSEEDDNYEADNDNDDDDDNGKDDEHDDSDDRDENEDDD
ncbi:MAG: anti-sigma factor domain-containing protein [Eubacteriales bacterium]|nr:anti-sigma factor domain-containing protein [Eubacteriales bacterium]